MTAGRSPWWALARSLVPSVLYDLWARARMHSEMAIFGWGGSALSRALSSSLAPRVKRRALRAFYRPMPLLGKKKPQPQDDHGVIVAKFREAGMLGIRLGDHPDGTQVLRVLEGSSASRQGVVPGAFIVGVPRRLLHDWLV